VKLPEKNDSSATVICFSRKLKKYLLVEAVLKNWNFCTKYTSGEKHNHWNTGVVTGVIRET